MKKDNDFIETLRIRNSLRSRGKPTLELISLKCGYRVWADWSSEMKCQCGEAIWWAITDKNKRSMPISKVAEGVFDTHFASCPLVKEKRKK